MMLHGKFISSKLFRRLFARSLSYAASIAVVFFLLVYCKEQNLRSTFIFVTEIGMLVVIFESLFTIRYVNTRPEKPRHLSSYTFRHHAINHLLYPFIFYVGYVAYVYFEENSLLAIILGFIGFILYFFYYFLLPKHIQDGHIDKPRSRQVSATIDFVMYLYKFVSFFIINLALFQGYAQSRISLNVIFIINLFVMLLFYFFHLNRLDKLSKLNIFIAFLFSTITSLAIIYAKTSVINFSSAIATLLFYLSSGIYYHKMDGTLDHRVLIEYSSIAVIASIFLFSL